MKVMINSVIIRALALLLAASVAFAQERVAFAQEQAAFRQEELDQMLAPIALYPDSLLSQILMASTYPLEVVQAARWSRARPGLKGLDAVQAAEPMDWDPSVKSLTAFPQVLSMMDEKIDWTQRLGEAFLAQQPQVMDTVQRLRAKAAEAGNLGAGERARVTREGEDILIEPADPQLVYVPYYDPTVVYGPWWWPAYPPVYWAPWPGYYVSTAYAPGFIWGSGVVISTGFFFGNWDWPHRRVTVVRNQYTNVHVNRGTTIVNRTNVAPNAGPVAWRHDPVHRRGVPYRNAALRQQFGPSRASAADMRRDFRGRDAAQAARLENRRQLSATGSNRSQERRDAVTALEGRRQAAPDRAVTQDNVKPAQRNDGRTDAPVAIRRPDERGRTPGALQVRQSQSDRPAARSNDRRSDPRGDTTRIQARGIAPRPAVAAPAARPDARPSGAAPNGDRNARRPVPSESGRRADTRGAGDDRVRANDQGAMMRDTAPAARPSTGNGNPAPRAGNGNDRGNGGAKSRGGGRRTEQRDGNR